MNECEGFMRSHSANQSFWKKQQTILNEVTPDPVQRAIFVDMIESFWECQGHKVELLPPASREWMEKLRKKLSEYLDYEDEKCSIILGLEENLVTTFVLQLVRITKKEKEELSSQEAAAFDDQLHEYWELHHQLWVVFAHQWRDSFRWRRAFRHMVDKIYRQLHDKLPETHTNDSSTKNLLESERSELMSKSYLAINWKGLLMNLLDDYLHFHEKTCPIRSHSPTKQDKREFLQTILGVNWKACRLRLLDQARKCTSWKNPFISVVESVLTCLSQSDSDSRKRLLDFNKKCEDMENSFLPQDFEVDARTVEIVEVTIAEVMRFQLKELQDANVAIQVGNYLAFLKTKKDSLPIVLRADSFENFYLLASNFCEYQQSGAIFAQESRSPQPVPILRVCSLPDREMTEVQLTMPEFSPPTSTEAKIDATSTILSAENLSVEIKSNQDLLLRLKLGPEGKTISFIDNREDGAFVGTISVDFPPYSVLAEEKVVLEIVPESIVEAYNQKLAERREDKNSGEPEIKLITPVVHIDRENDAPFLNTVTVTLPALSSITDSFHDFEIGAPTKISVDIDSLKVSATKFSPVAVTSATAQDVKRILRPLKLDQFTSYSFDELGIYLLSEQFENGHFRMDLRKFSDWQEHRRFRMDESKGLILVTSPQKVQRGDINTEVDATLRAPIVVLNDWANDGVNEEENKVTFHFPDPEFLADESNVRDVTLHAAEECQKIQLKFHFNTENLRISTNIKGWLVIPYHPESLMADFLTRRVLNTDRAMIRLLELLGENWLRFVCSYLEVDVNGFYEFLGRDIRETFAPQKLHWLPQNVRHLKNVCILRGFDFPEFSQNSGEIIEAIFSNFRTVLELGVAKREIRVLLLESGIITHNENFTDNLLQRNREILAAALMYVPMSKMKRAVRKAFEEEDLLSIDYRLQKFIYDGYPVGENL